MSHESSEFINRVVDESTIEYSQRAEQKKREAKEHNFLAEYLATREEGSDRIQAVVWLATYCSEYAPKIMANAIAIHKQEYPTS